MTAEHPITRADGWRRYERQDLALPIDFDASTTQLRWVLLNQPGGSLILEKVRATPEGENPWDDTEITGGAQLATIHIDETTDYAELTAGTYYHELWDTDAASLVLFGDVFLGEGTPPPEEP